jgi:hypothetical protein
MMQRESPASTFDVLQSDGNPAAYCIPGIPYHFQITSWYCGPASLQMIMDFLGEEVGQHNIADVANDIVGSGTYRDDMRRAAHFSGMSIAVQDPSLQGYNERQLGYACMSSSFLSNQGGRLKNTVYAQYPVFTLTWFDASHSAGHYRVVKGYDDSLDVFVIHDPWYSGYPSGPDLLINQSYFIDDLWAYSGHWCMVVSPWLLKATFASSVAEGDTFTVDLDVVYPGPTRFKNQYTCASCEATINLSSGLALAGGSATIALPDMSSDDTVSVSWDVVAVGPPGDWGMAFQAQGILSGSCGSYPSYTDSIGGHAYETVTVGGSLLAAWDAEERLTDDDGSSETCFPGARAMAVGGDGDVHLVWADTRDDTGEIYYRKRVESTWETEVRLTQDPGHAHSPCIAEGADGRLHVAWVDSRDGNYEIYYKSCDPVGGWSTDERVTTYGEVDCFPAIAAGDTAIYLAWEQRQGGAYRTAAVFSSVRTGLGWSTPIDVDASPARDSYRPSLAFGPDGLLHLVYERQTSNVPDEYEKVVYKSWDGSLWSSRTGLSSDLSFSRSPVIATASDSTLHVVWQDGENTGGDIFYVLYDGTSWQTVEQIVTGGTEACSPSVAVDGSLTVHVAWVDHRHGDSEVYYMSKDGSGWREDVRFTQAQAASVMPTIATNSGGRVCVVWTDLRHGNADLYFRATSSGSGVGAPVVIDISKKVLLSYPYPMPFTSQARIAFTVTEPSEVFLDTYDVEGRLVKTLASGYYGAGTYRATWDGTTRWGGKAAPGVYYIRCASPLGIDTKRIVYVR